MTWTNSTTTSSPKLCPPAKGSMHSLAATALLNPIYVSWHVLWIGHSSRHHGDHKDPPHHCCQEFTAGMGKLDLAHRHGFQAALGSRAASGLSRVLGNQLGEDLSALDKSLDLSSSKKGLGSTISVISQFRQAGLHPRLPCRSWEMGLGQAFGRLGGEEGEEVAQAT